MAGIACFCYTYGKRRFDFQLAGALQIQLKRFLFFRISETRFGQKM